ncbi:MAG: hypothetical protein ACREJQ_00090, partial [bacterium]
MSPWFTSHARPLFPLIQVAALLAAVERSAPVVTYPDCHPLAVESTVFMMAGLYFIWWALTRMVEERHKSYVLSLM